MNLNILTLFVYSSYSHYGILYLILALFIGFMGIWFGLHYVVTIKPRHKEKPDKLQPAGQAGDPDHPEAFLPAEHEKLLQLSKLFTGVFANSSEAITFIQVLDQGQMLRIIDMNPVARKLSGLSRVRIEEGIDTKDIMPDRNYQHFIKEILPKALDGNVVNYVEEWNQGREYWEASVYPLRDQSGKVTHLAVFSKNKTSAYEQKRLSAILQSVIDNRPMEFCACDSDGIVFFQNLMSRQKYGDLMGKRLSDTILPNSVEIQRTEITRRILNEEDIVFEGSDMVSGQMHWFSYRLMPIVADNKVCGYSYAVIDITEHVQHQKEMLRSAIDTEEKERLRFSQELHDGLGPLISAAKLYTGLLVKPTKDIDMVEIARDIYKLLEESTSTIKDISFKLSPHILKNFGVAEALKSYSEKVINSCQTTISVNFANIPRFDDLIETVIYRVVCECINNTLRYAEATSVSIDLQVLGHMLVVNYADNGKGFDVDKTLQERTGIGLLNMQSRLKSINSIFSMESSAGHGFKLFIKVPL